MCITTTSTYTCGCILTSLDHQCVDVRMGKACTATFKQTANVPTPCLTHKELPKLPEGGRDPENWPFNNPPNLRTHLGNEDWPLPNPRIPESGRGDQSWPIASPLTFKYPSDHPRPNENWPLQGPHDPEASRWRDSQSWPIASPLTFKYPPDHPRPSENWPLQGPPNPEASRWRDSRTFESPRLNDHMPYNNSPKPGGSGGAVNWPYKNT